ncbi:Protein of unknown function [Trichlorobacter thiogenes]|uniref:DUF3373 domain-containing protein n=1 Tax=Trichlorobacter thiogenes TaxID=115783 RepID=A0A1T4M7G5_9BACT|nr:DUF3373 domain-containing protein [Trichlorobacter thiogenes]SJZ62738.1 Protein of unknown function [Trichlorobacter thiogenes]
MRKANKLLLSTVLALAIPAGAMAAEADLQVKIDRLSQQMEDLKGQVQKIEDKSLGKWLQIGGNYQFRMDSLHGKTAAYSDAYGTMQNMQMYAQMQYFSGNTTPYTTMTSMMGLTNYSAAANFLNTYGMALQAMMGTAGVVQVPAAKIQNETMYSNKFNLDLKAKATKDVTVNVRLGMYKSFGNQDDKAVNGNAYFADRTGIFDGTLGHVPSNSYLNVDRAYATWSNILDQPVWFSVGRRPATDGAPTNLKSNNERPGNGGTPALLVNYAFDGMTLGYAPDIDFLPGFYAKVCYGRAFESGFRNTPNKSSLKDTDMMGVAVIPVDTDPLRVWLQWNRGFNIFDFPTMNNTAFGNTAPSVNLGSIDWYGIGVMSSLKKVGPGDLNFFLDGGMNVTHPTTAVSANAGFQGLLTGGFMSPEAPSDKTGYAVFAGVRYDLPSKTKLGFEFNYGTKNWIPFDPSADDMWTSKLGTRGKVYEPYIIQEIDLKPISSFFAKTFFKLGYQYYDFEYTGSNNWVGAPIKISDITANTMLLQGAVKNAHDIYGTFEVHF